MEFGIGLVRQLTLNIFCYLHFHKHLARRHALNVGNYKTRNKKWQKIILLTLTKNTLLLY